MRTDGTTQPLSEQEQLFLSVVEQLKRPLVQITRLNELATVTTASESGTYRHGIDSISDAALTLLENYDLSLRLRGGLMPADMAPVAVTSLLYDTAHELDAYAKQYDVRLELDTAPRLKPVLGDRRILQAAMTSLGQVFISAQAENNGAGVVTLGAHRSRFGVVAGMYGAPHNLGTDNLRRAKSLMGRAREPLSRLTSGPAAGVFVAEALLMSLAAHLHVARYHNLTGLAATLPTSQQLQLV